MQLFGMAEQFERSSMKKKIDSVKLMREIRDKLSEEYSKDKEKELKELQEKFGHLKKKKDAA